VKIPLPNLDDRRWADLVDEGRALIPLYALERMEHTWTDHNVHDPGITLIELFAWMAEMDIYQLNRIPAAHKQKFLALVGIRPEPPRPARTVLHFSLAPGTPELELPAGIECRGDDPQQQAVHFRTLAPLTVLPGAISAVLVKDQHGWQDQTHHWQRGEHFGLFGAIPQPGAELYIGFSTPLPPQVPVTLYFTFAGSRVGEDERQRFLMELQKQQRDCRTPPPTWPAAQPPPPPAVPAVERVPPHHGVRLTWEMLTRQGAASEWRQLATQEVDDDTRALTLDGSVRLRLPVAMAQPQTNFGPASPQYYYIRVRFAAGAYDAPPLLHSLVLNGVAAEQAVPIGTMQRIAEQDLLAVLLGEGNGMPHQTLTLPVAPLQLASFQLFSHENNEWHSWQLRPDFDASTHRDYHYLLEPTSGIVTFGSGEKGRVPPLQAKIYAVYHATRAAAGNLAPHTINRLADASHHRNTLPSVDLATAPLQVTNPVSASGGTAAETLDSAVSRAVPLLNTTERAVTLTDYEGLALVTPGTQVARANARANLHPAFPCLKAPGMITLTILPAMPVARPTPSPGLRRMVAAYLHHRRILGTRVEVVGPTYLEVIVRARVRAYPGVSKSSLQQQVVAALNDFLDPLRGGPERTGWPFGRDVYRTEILQVIDEVSGVDHVLALELITDGCEPQCGNVCLAPTWLVAAGQHDIEVV
jgi:predicted phage baseplate assembly protein